MMSLLLLAAVQTTSLEAAATLLRAGRAAEAADAAGTIVAELDRRNAGEKRRIYCASSPAETLLYMLAAAKDKVSAVAQGPELCDALFLQAYALVEQERVADALPLLDRAVGMAPSNAHYLNEQAYALQSLRRWPESLAAFTRAADAASLVEPRRRTAEQTRAWRGAAFVLVEQGKLDEAEAMLRRCLKVDPDDAKAKSEMRHIRNRRAAARPG